VDETLRYAAEQKNKPTFSVEIEDIKIFIGFLIFSGYNRLPSERDYFSDAEDLGVQLVKDVRNAQLHREANLPTIREYRQDVAGKFFENAANHLQTPSCANP
jgi:hypothetical protein